MAENSNIEWTTHTFNPWIGCTKVSPGCKNCYAETLDKNRFSKTLGGATKENPISHWGKGAPRYRTSPALWHQPLNWNKKPWICDKCGGASDKHYDHTCTGKPEDACHTSNVTWQRARVFPSLCDWLDDEVPAEWLADFLQLIYGTPNLNWLLLTKRPENFGRRIQQAIGTMHCDPMDIGDRLHEWTFGNLIPKNIWIGTSVEDKLRKDRISKLKNIPAILHFVSLEPLLEDLGELNLTGIQWGIVGGESGSSGRRDCGVNAICNSADQLVKAGVRCFVKQDCAAKPGQQGRIPDHIWRLKQMPAL